MKRFFLKAADPRPSEVMGVDLEVDFSQKNALALSRKRMVFEAIEPRILLSADLHPMADALNPELAGSNGAEAAEVFSLASTETPLVLMSGAVNGASYAVNGALFNKSTAKIIEAGETIILDSTLDSELVVRGNVTLSGATTTHAITLDGGTLTLINSTVSNTTITQTENGGTVTAASGTLDNVILDTDLTVTGVVHVTNGLKLNSTLTLGASARLQCTGTQTISGSGMVVFEDSTNLYVYGASSVPAVLTVDDGVTLRITGSTGTISNYHGSLINKGTIIVDTGSYFFSIVVTSLTNEGTIRVNSGKTLSLSTLTNVAGATIAVIGTSTLTLTGTLDISGDSQLLIEPSGKLNLAGNMTGNVTDPALYNPQGTVTVTGGTSTAPRLIEVMSQNQGPDASGFAQNFAYGALSLARNARVKLINESDNAVGDDPDALYVMTLTVSTGATLDLNGLTVYARTINVQGTILNGEVIQVTSGFPYTDLTVTNVIAPATAAAGEQVELEWTVTNSGDQATNASTWYDRVILSADAQVGNSDDIVLGTFQHDGTLGPEESYTATAAVTLPAGLRGDFQLFVVTDVTDTVYEFFREHNNASAATAAITVTAANHAPVANDDVASGIAGTAITGNVLDNDIDPDGDDLAAELVSNAAFGTVELLPDGSFTYTPNTGFFGKDSFTYRAYDGEAYSTDAMVLITVAAAADPFQVTEVTPTASGVHLRFSHALDLDALNLFDTESQGLGAADLVLTGAAGGAVSGSIVVDADGKGLTFIKTGGILAADTYTLTLSGVTDVQGRSLEDTRRFTVETQDRVLSIGDFVRGPGQAVNVPAAGEYLPVILSQAEGIEQISFVLTYDTDLLTVVDVLKGADLGDDVALKRGIDGVDGRVYVTLTGALSGTNVELIRLVAGVPSSAAYGATQILRLTDIKVNTGAIVADEGLHVAAYFGDLDGDGRITTEDAQLVTRVVVGKDTGFAVSLLTDPKLLGDITGDGLLNAQDARAIAQEAAWYTTGTEKYNRPEIPEVPDLSMLATPAWSQAFATSLGQSDDAVISVDLPAGDTGASQLTSLSEKLLDILTIS